MSRHRYPTEICRVFERTTADKLHQDLTSFKEPEISEPVNDAQSNVSDKPKKDKQGKNKGGSGNSSDPSQSTSDGNRAKQTTLKNVLGEALGYGPALSEHMILDAGLVPNAKFSKNNIFDNGTMQTLIQAVARFEDWLEDVISGDRVPEGYILMQNKNLVKGQPPSESGSASKVIAYLSIIAFSL